MSVGALSIMQEFLIRSTIKAKNVLSFDHEPYAKRQTSKQTNRLRNNKASIPKATTLELLIKSTD